VYPPADDPLLAEQGLMPDGPMPDQGPATPPGMDSISALLSALSMPQAPGPSSVPMLPSGIAPPVSQNPKQQLMALAALAAAIAGGPRSGLAGLPRGVMAGQQQLQQQADRRAQQEQALAIQRQHAMDAQQRVDEDHRMKRERALNSVTQAVQSGQFQTPEDYNDFIDRAGNTLVASGYRDLTPGSLRNLQPYRPPDAESLAEKALKKYYGDPTVAARMKVDPMSIMHDKIRLAKGQEPIPITEVLKLAGREMPIDAQGLSVPMEQMTEFRAATVAAKQEWANDHGGTMPAAKDNPAIFTRARQMMQNKDEQLTDLQKEIAGARLDVLRGQKGNKDQNDSDLEDNAQQLVDGNILPSMLSKRGATYNATLSKANRLSIEQTGKPLNFIKLQLDYEAAKRFATSLNGPNMVRFQGLANSVVNTIDEVKRLGAELKQGSIQKWNKAKRGTIQQVYGNTPQSEAAAQYMAAVTTLKEEFASLVQGGFSPTESAFALANQQVNGDYGIKDLNASLTEVQRLINYRLQGFRELKPMLPGGPSGQTPSGDTPVETWERGPDGKLRKVGG